MTTLYMVKSNPVDGKDDEFNRWYTDVHLPEVLQIDGFESAQRFCLTEQQIQPQSRRYLAIYTINGDDIDGTLANLRSMRSFNMSDALDMSSIEISIFEQI